MHDIIWKSSGMKIDGNNRKIVICLAIKGITGCRLCRPAGMKSSTSPVELVDITATEDGEERLQTKIQKTEITYEVIPQEEMMQFPTKHSES